ncbi:unnamed protein product [Amoebophrya sp. A25]|nr:unnamed protein product [Amoebophrya sp. A25]|eukprot:GSA25T00016638001.1
MKHCKNKLFLTSCIQSLRVSAYRSFSGSLSKQAAVHFSCVDLQVMICGLKSPITLWIWSS